MYVLLREVSHAPNIVHTAIRVYSAKALIRNIEEGEMLLVLEGLCKSLPFFCEIRAARVLTATLENEYRSLRSCFDDTQDISHIHTTSRDIKVVIGFILKPCMSEQWRMIRPARRSYVDASLFIREMLLQKHSTNSIGTCPTNCLNRGDLDERWR